jgi:hypothetical protein
MNKTACMYIPKDLAEDIMFPIKATPANPEVRIKISFKAGDNKLTIEKWKENNEACMQFLWGLHWAQTR